MKNLYKKFAVISFVIFTINLILIYIYYYFFGQYNKMMYTITIKASDFFVEKNMFITLIPTFLLLIYSIYKTKRDVEK